MIETTRTAAVFVLCAVALAGCAQQPGSGPVAKRSSEYFPASKYGPASQRVVQDGQRVPRGGGQYLVGRPYTIAGKRYVPREMGSGQAMIGGASWYGDAFHGRRTANGEIYDMRSISAAHPTMPLPSYARVTNVKNNRSIIVRVNDRGPFHPGRVIDLSRRTAEALDFRHLGTAQVKVEYVGRAGLAGSDDQILIASLTTDGRPAHIDGVTTAPRTMVAEAAQVPFRTTMGQAAPAPQPVAVQQIAAQQAQLATPQRQLAPAQATTVAMAEVAPVQDAGAAPLAALPAYAPAPPPRPFDLMTIPGADTPIMGRRRTSQASFFAPPSPVAATLIQRGPFEGVDLNGLRDLR